MNRSWRRLVFLGLMGASVIFASRTAIAAHDAEASKLRDAAIYQDYLATDFAAAEAKLTQALALCQKPSACAPALRARLHSDLAAIYFVSKKAAQGRAEFVAAAKDDPNVTLDSDLGTPELQKELTAAKAAAAKGAPGKGDAAAEAPPAKGAATDDDAESAGGAASHPSSAADSDCPPGFPGCNSGEKPEATSCASDDDCAGGEKCDDHRCVDASHAPSGPGKANWVSVAFQPDFVLLPAKHDVCLGGQGYSCFKSNGTSYTDTPATNYGGQVVGGLKPGTMRILLGYDRALGPNLTVGGALGFAFNGGPKRVDGSAFVPLHVEVRGKYWFGGNPLGRAGFRFFGEIQAGFAEAAASIGSVVYTQGSTQPTNVTAWYHAGRGFGGLGLGAVYAFAPNMGVSLELRGQEMFPTTGTVLAAQLGYTLGL